MVWGPESFVEIGQLLCTLPEADSSHRSHVFGVFLSFTVAQLFFHLPFFTDCSSAPYNRETEPRGTEMGSFVSRTHHLVGNTAPLYHKLARGSGPSLLQL